MENLIDLHGKHILITGASSGIGKETAILASRLGARVSMIARNEDKLLETERHMEGVNNHYISFDLSSMDEISSVIDYFVTLSGKIDGFVHCAGVAEGRPVKQTKPEVLQRVLQIHLGSFVEIVRTLSLKNRTNGEASFIGVSSISALKGDKIQSSYAAAKGAISSIVHPMAKELYKSGIRVNAIAFGYVDTEMFRKDYLKGGKSIDGLMDDQFLGIIPVEYAAKANVFLLSDLSKYMTGQTMIYDGGYLS